MMTRKEAAWNTSGYILGSAISGAVAGSQIFVKATGMPGAAAGFLVGKGMEAMGKTTRNLIRRWRDLGNREQNGKTMAFNPVLVCQLLGAGATAMAGYSTGFSFVLGSMIIGSAAHTVRALVSSKKVFTEFRQSGLSATMEQHLGRKRRSLFDNILEGDTTGIRRISSRLSQITPGLKTDLKTGPKGNKVAFESA